MPVMANGGSSPRRPDPVGWMSMHVKEEKHVEILRKVVNRCLVPLFLCYLTSGCAPLVLFGAGTAAGIAGFKYFDGTMYVSYQAPYMDTWDATDRALREMGYGIRSSGHGMTSGKIVATDPETRTVHITVEYKSSKETEVGIKVGLFGDEKASAVIVEQIRRVLFEN
jgi:hypothetical protein